MREFESKIMSKYQQILFSLMLLPVCLIFWPGVLWLWILSKEKYNTSNSGAAGLGLFFIFTLAGWLLLGVLVTVIMGAYLFLGKGNL